MFIFQLSKYESDLSCASMVVIDGNISAEAMQYICELCDHTKVPGKKQKTLYDVQWAENITA